VHEGSEAERIQEVEVWEEVGAVEHLLLYQP
jgi:hypothetical protein